MYGGEERRGVWMSREEGELLKEIVGLFWDPSEVLARTVGEGVRKMMKEREGWKKGNETLGCVVCLHVLNHCITLLLLVHTYRSIKRVRGRESLRLVRDAETGGHEGSMRGDDLLRVTMWIRLLELTSNTVYMWGLRGSYLWGLNICVGQGGVRPDTW